jgi:hypothetical protein
VTARRRKRAAGADSWRSPGALLAVAALAVSLVSLYLSWDSALTARLSAETGQREAARRSLLELSAVSAYLGDDLDGRTIPPAGEGVSEKRAGLRGPRIDVTVRNRGSGDGLIDTATVKVRRSGVLSSCYNVGGAMQIAANYDIPLDLAAAPPYTVTKQVRFSVAAGQHDRLSLTVGPGSDNHGLEPWLGVVTVLLHYADGQDIELGPIALVDVGQNPRFHPEGTRWVIKPTQERSCMRLNARTVREIAATDGITLSKEFASLNQAMRPYL